MILSRDQSEAFYAYIKLKQSIYYETTDLFQRREIAYFESEESFHENIAFIDNIFNNAINGIKPSNKSYKKLLEKISYKIMPKKVSCNQNEECEAVGIFLSNNKTSREYVVDGLNYYISLPVELRIIDTLWTMYCGYLLDFKLGNSCFSNRLIYVPGKSHKNDGRLFKIYFNEYSAWRDSALSTAEQLLLENKHSVALLSMDIKSCYYSIDINKIEVLKTIRESIEYIKANKEESNITIFNDHFYEIMTDLVINIYDKYIESINEHISITHEISNNKRFLPIGLNSSKVLCNWYLNKLDDRIIDSINPDYYGRYVDDILMVVKDPNMDAISHNPVKGFMEKYFVNNKVLIYKEKEPSAYVTVIPEGMIIQEEKLILHYLNKNSNKATLALFRNEIEKNASIFRFLPTEESNKKLEEYAYDILYDGSSNKIRSVVGVLENSIKLSKYIAHKIIEYRLTDNRSDKEVNNQLMEFFRGRNFITYCTHWERYFNFSIINNGFYDCSLFFKEAMSNIKKIKRIQIFEGKESEIVHLKTIEKLKETLYEHLLLSIAMSYSLLNQNANGKDEKRKKYLKKIIEEKIIDNILNDSRCFRKANMLRHALVSFPLLNYVDDKSDMRDPYLFDILVENKKDAILSKMENAFQYSPRHVHYDEVELFVRIYELYLNSHNYEMSQWIEDRIEVEEILKTYNKYFQANIETPKVEYVLNNITEEEKNNEKNKGYLKLYSSFFKKDKDFNLKKEIYEIGKEVKAEVKVAIANMDIKIEDIRASYCQDKRPNVSMQRQNILYDILNTANKENTEMLILPELSIPHRWLPFMVSYARRHQIALVFGLEHWVIGKYAHNLLVTILPFKENGQYKNARVFIREKNHYSPNEKRNIKAQRLTPAEGEKKKYYMFVWDGLCFAPYNCFELADINHRSIFKSRIDILTACVWNPDTRYFSNIIESISRDLHCFVIQANSSTYGDSRVTAPRKTDEMDIIKVKGGENSTILTATLKIKELREFQTWEDEGLNDKKYKPTPPGYEREDVRLLDIGSINAKRKLKEKQKEKK